MPIMNTLCFKPVISQTLTLCIKDSPDFQLPQKPGPIAAIPILSGCISVCTGLSFDKAQFVSVAKKKSSFDFCPEQIFLNHLKPNFQCESVKWNGPPSV